MDWTRATEWKICKIETLGLRSIKMQCQRLKVRSDMRTMCWVLYVVAKQTSGQNHYSDMWYITVIVIWLHAKQNTGTIATCCILGYSQDCCKASSNSNHVGLQLLQKVEPNQAHHTSKTMRSVPKRLIIPFQLNNFHAT